MTRIAAVTVEEMPSPIKPMEDSLSSNDQVHTPRPPPSPLETEVDSEGGPSSVEAQADPNDLSFDLDLSKFLNVFVIVVTLICQSCDMDLLEL